MKPLNLICFIIWGLSIGNIHSQTTPILNYTSNLVNGAACPLNVNGIFDPSLPVGNPDIFSPAVKTEIMTDGFQGLDKEYGDIDNDGDIDILYTKNNDLYFIENVGSPTVPDYQVVNAVFTGITDVYSFRLFLWDNDAKMDLIVLENLTPGQHTITLFLDINAQIGFPAPFATLVDGTQFPFSTSQLIEVGDLNGDGLPDILISDQASISGTAYFENTGTPPYLLTGTQTLLAPFIPENGGSYPCPELYDTNCDGDLDLLISDPLYGPSPFGGARVFFYENIGPATSGTIPNFNLSGQTNVFGFNDIDLPNEDLHCDWVITRIVDFFGDDCPEAIAYNPCHNNSPTGDIFYYKQFCEPVGIDVNEPLDHFQAWYVEHTIHVRVSSNEMASATATLFDISGIQIYQEKDLFLLGLNEIQLAAGNLPTGIYLLTIHTGNRLMVEKVFVR